METCAYSYQQAEESIGKELDTVMGGKVLELQCDKAMNKAFAEGIAQGEASGERKMAITMAQSMLKDHKEMGRNLSVYKALRSRSKRVGKRTEIRSCVTIRKET